MGEHRRALRDRSAGLGLWAVERSSAACCRRSVSQPAPSDGLAERSSWGPCSGPVRFGDSERREVGVVVVSIAKARRYRKRLGTRSVGSVRGTEVRARGLRGCGEGFRRAVSRVGGRRSSRSPCLALRADDLETQRRQGSSARLAFLISNGRASNGSASARAALSGSRYLRGIDQPPVFPPCAQ